MSQIRRASVQYNDLKGTIAIDFHGGGESDLWDYARSHNIDTDEYFPIGLSFYIEEGDFFSLKFICIDNNQKESFQEKNNGKVPLVIFNRDETLDSFLSQIKRVEAVLRFKQNEFEPHEVVQEFDEAGNKIQ